MSELARQNRTFYEIADDLAAYFETLALTEDRLQERLPDGERAQLEQDRADLLRMVETIGAELCKKADAVAGVLRRQKIEIEALAAEEMRLTKRRLMIERGEKWLKEYVMSSMRLTGQKSIRTDKTTLRIQANGGVEPLVVTNFDLVPDDLKDVTVVMPQLILNQISGELFIESDPCLSQIRHIKTEVSNARMREALTKPCVVCIDPVSGEPRLGYGDKHTPCTVCNGTGRATVPGAHLGERGEHLRVL